jgi:hypothetical protein
MRFRAILRKWWEGKSVELNKPGDMLIVMGGDHREWHWTARIARASLQYAQDNHRWIIGMLIAAGILRMR